VPANNCTSPRLTVAFTFDVETLVSQNKQINTENLFPTPMWWIDLNLDNDALVEECYQIKSSEPSGRTRSTRNGYQSNDLDPDVTKQNLSKLVTEITAASNTIFKSYYLKDDDTRELYVCNYWVNINSNGGHHIRHTHPGAFISGVYYVKCVSDLDQGAIRFWRPEHEDFIVLQHDLTTDSMHYSPVQGRLILFPSHLAHSVDSNQFSNDRIAVSFNLKIDG
jgi:uncharacterized protein (TIGR02466 family)